MRARADVAGFRLGPRRRSLVAPSQPEVLVIDMDSTYTIFPDLAAEAPIPARGILSQTLSNEEGVEFLLFGFAPGEQLSEHTSARPAIIHILQGEGELIAAGDSLPALPGTWLRMRANV